MEQNRWSTKPKSEGSSPSTGTKWDISSMVELQALNLLTSVRLCDVSQYS